MFSPLQKRIISWAATGAALTLLFVLLVGLIVLCGKFLSTFAYVVWPLFIAMILALLVQPISGFLVKRCKFSPALSAGTLLLIVLTLLSLVLFLVIPRALVQFYDFAQSLPVIWTGALAKYPEFADWLNDLLSEGGLSQYFKEGDLGVLAKETLENAFPKINTLISNAESVFSAVAAFALIPIYFYYLLSEEHDFIGKLTTESYSILPQKVADDCKYLLEQFRDIIVAYFRGQFMVVTCYGAILAGGFLISGLPSALLLGFGLGYLNMIPYFGTVVGLCFVFPLAFFTGGISLLFWVFVVFCIAQFVEAYFLTPKIMNRYTGLHPMVVLLSLFFWAIALNGILGMVLAVPLTAFFVVFWRLLKKNYLRHGNGI